MVLSVKLVCVVEGHNMRIWLLLGLIFLAGCSTSVESEFDGILTKEYMVGGERVIVGGEPVFGGTIQNFNPEVKLEKWGDETHIRVWTDEAGDDFATEKDGKIVWHNADKSKEYNFYPLAPTEQYEDGGFEYEIILKEKPKSNVVTLKIDTQDLVFYYQPELTQEEIDKGASRPENVIGSYAVYHATKANHKIGETNYKTGKAFHIYRPNIIAANSDEIWGELLIEDGLLTITIDQTWLDTAVYPVIVDPTVGYTELGASGSSSICNVSSDTSTSAGKSNDSFTVLSEAGTLDSITFGLAAAQGAQTVDTFFAIYDEDGAASNSHSLIASVEELNKSIAVSPALYTINAASEELSADTYIIASLCNGVDIVGSPRTVSIRADTGGSGWRFYLESSTGAGGYATRKAEDPWTEVDSSSSFLNSAYFTYTAAAAEVGSPEGIIEAKGIIKVKGIIKAK